MLRHPLPRFEHDALDLSFRPIPSFGVRRNDRRV
jgi:hypothetical protein